MFGNGLGWVMSLVLAALGAFGGYQLLLIAQPTAPTGWVQATIKPFAMADAITANLPPMTDRLTDAGDLYRQAIEDYRNHKTEYDELQKMKDFDDAEVPIASRKGLDALVKAASCPTMKLFERNPAEVVNFQTNIQALDDLHEIALTVGAIIATAKADKHYDVAEKYANALLALGLHLYQERLAYIELDAAESFIGMGNKSLMALANIDNPKKAPALEDLNTKRLAEYDMILKVYAVINGQGQSNIGAHAGDMFAIAADPTIDRVWRTEAIRKIGRLQFNAENMADQKKAPRFLREMADSEKDPVIRTAYIAARDMTEYDNQSQR